MHGLIATLIMTPELMIQAVAPVIPATDQSVIDGFLEAIGNGTAAYGWVGGLAAALSGLVMTFRLLFPGWWEKLPSLAKPLLAFAFAAVGAGLMSWIGGIPIVAAITSAIVAGLAAVGVHQNAKALRAAGAKKP